MKNKLIRLYTNLSLKLKLSFLFSLLLLAVVLFVYIYFPAKRQAFLLNSYLSKTTDIGKMTAYILSPSVVFDDRISCNEAFDNTKQNKELLYLIVEKWNSAGNGKYEFFTAYNFSEGLKRKYKEAGIDYDNSISKASLPILSNGNTIGILHIGLSLDNVKKELYEMKISIGIASLLILIIGTIAVYIISMFITKPLYKFIGTIKDISHKNLDTRVNISSNDEVGQLALTFNKMIDELQSAYGTVANMNKTLETRVAERTYDLEQSKKRFETLYNQTPVMLHSVDKQNKCVVNVSDYWLTSLGYSRDEVINKSIGNFLTPNSKEYYDNVIWQKFFNNGWCTEEPLQIQKKNGEVIDALLSATGEQDTSGNVLRSLSVLQDITDKKKVLQALTIAKEEAERSDKFKSEFLAQMSHEIRSPLNVVFSFARLIKEEIGGTTNPVLEESFNALELAGNRIIRTINMILDMSEVQTGSYQPEYKELDLMNDVLVVICSQYKFEADKKNLAVNLHSNLTTAKITADEYSITQVFANLLDNAIKYTQQGKIDIVISYDTKKNILVSVIDSGIGISQEYIPNLFKPFSQEEQGYSRKYEGNGLGLALIKKYCDLNNASISVESEKDKGSAFTVVFSK